MADINLDPFALARDDEPVSAEQLAAFDFEPMDAASVAGMIHDFSANAWSAECANHGVALRLAAVLLEQTKEAMVTATDEMERAVPAARESPTKAILDTLQRSRERFTKLAQLLRGTEMRQLSALAVLELRYGAEEQS